MTSSDLSDRWIAKKSSGVEITYEEVLDIVREDYPKFDPSTIDFSRKFKVCFCFAAI